MLSQVSRLPARPARQCREPRCTQRPGPSRGGGSWSLVRRECLQVPQRATGNELRRTVASAPFLLCRRSNAPNKPRTRRAIYLSIYLSIHIYIYKTRTRRTISPRSDPWHAAQRCGKGLERAGSIPPDGPARPSLHRHPPSAPIRARPPTVRGRDSSVRGRDSSVRGRDSSVRGQDSSREGSRPLLRPGPPGSPVPPGSYRARLASPPFPAGLLCRHLNRLYCHRRRLRCRESLGPRLPAGRAAHRRRPGGPDRAGGPGRLTCACRPCPCRRSMRRRRRPWPCWPRP